MDKVKTKQVWQGSDYRQHHIALLAKESDLTEVVANLVSTDYQPVLEGSSVGMSKVEKAEDLQLHAKATQHDAVVMAEKWITDVNSPFHFKWSRRHL